MAATHYLDGGLPTLVKKTLTSLTYLVIGASNRSTGWHAFHFLPYGSANSISMRCPVTEVTFMLTDWPIMGQLSNSKIWLYCKREDKRTG